MIEYAIFVLLGAAVIVGMLGFSGIIGAAAVIAKVLFVVLLIFAGAGFVYSLRNVPVMRLRPVSRSRMSGNGYSQELPSGVTSMDIKPRVDGSVQKMAE